MVNFCKGTCVRIEGAKISSRGTREGQKRCKLCEYRIKTDELRCPCCRSIYRINVRRTNKITKVRN